MFVPSFYLAKPKLTTAIDLSDFVAEDEWARYDMSRPFRQGDLTYATDAHICVRTRLGVSDLADVQAKLPPAATLPWDAGDDWLPWPDRQWVPAGVHYGRFNCPECNGKTRVGPGIVDCAVCSGRGGDFFDRDGRYYTHCDNCNGRSYVGGAPCDYCGARGIVDNDVPSLQLLGDVTVDPSYDRKIRKLSNVEYQLVDAVPYGSVELRMIRFRCEGAEGLLMPVMRSD